MYAEATVDAGTGEADESAEFGRGPLWGRGVAVDACGVTREFLEGEELETVLEKMTSVAEIE